MDIDGSGLLEPISTDRPCGDDLEDTQLLASFDAFRIFGQTVPLDAETDWRDVRDRSLEALRTSKDFRLLAHLASAVVRTDGLDALVQVLNVAAKWLETWWDEVYPRIDDDAVLRRNALNGFADRMAVVDGVRRAVLLTHRQLGSLSIRDIEIATGQIPKPEGEGEGQEPPNESHLTAMLAATSPEELGRLRSQLNDSVSALKSIESTMRERGGPQGAPDFTALLNPLGRTLGLIASHADARAGAAVVTETADAEQPGAAPPAGRAALIGPIRSREDAVRALDAVSNFFRTSEPSSPVPLFIERAKRLVAKDFLSVLEDIAPDALAQAKAAGGVRDSE
jgi:type VI secretion system protein ImpA